MSPILLFIGAIAIGEFLVGLVFFAIFVDCFLEKCDTAELLTETRPNFINSNAVLVEIFARDRWADRIFSENYELYVHFSRTYVEESHEADIMQVRERMNTITRAAAAVQSNKVGSSMRASIKRMKSFRLKQEEPCMICFVEFEAPCEITVLGCNSKHFLHKECFEQWIKHHEGKRSKATCPLCRAMIDVSKAKTVTYKGLETPVE